MKYVSIAAFALGVIAGSVGTWYILKEKYDRRLQEDIDSVKARFTIPKTEPYEGPQDSDEEKRKISEEKAAANHDKPDIAEYAKILSKERYTKYSDSETEAEAPKEYPAPYVISPEQFREFDDYSVISLMFYADGVLADDDDRIMEDVDSYIGADALTHFGEFEDDSVYVRNDRLKVDYEILLSQKEYSEVVREKPYLKEE